MRKNKVYKIILVILFLGLIGTLYASFSGKLSNANTVMPLLLILGILTFGFSIQNLIFYKNKIFSILALLVSILALSTLGYAMYLASHPVY